MASLREPALFKEELECRYKMEAKGGSQKVTELQFQPAPFCDRVAFFLISLELLPFASRITRSGGVMMSALQLLLRMGRTENGTGRALLLLLGTSCTQLAVRHN